MRNRIVFLCSIFLLGVFARVAALPHDSAPRPGSDEDEYEAYAWNLAQGRGYRGPSPAYHDREHLTSWRMPGPSLMFAVVYKFVGRNPAAAAYTNIFISAATCIPLFFIGCALYGEIAGRISSFVYALWPNAMFLSTHLLSEPLYVFLLTLYVAQTFALARKPGVGNIAVNGLLLGALMYARPHVFLLPFLFIWIVLVFWPHWRTMLACLSVFVVAALMLTPWVVRNYRVHGVFVPFTTQAGSALVDANNRIVATQPEYYGFALSWERSIPEYKDLYSSVTNEVQLSALGITLYKQWMRQHPDKWWYLTESKFRRFWTPFLQQRNKFNRLVMLFSWGPVLILFPIPFLASFWSGLRNHDPHVMVHFAILSTLANSLFFGGIARYRFPIEGFCIVFAAGAALWLWNKLQPALPGLTPKATAICEQDKRIHEPVNPAT
ncbi:MAG: hypothetical protein ABSA12_04265 [Verrucomicrobiia bacterium]|jgi:4-amino-4-deoxy-L-arabinose transferase-like glycosyltransferase